MKKKTKCIITNNENELITPKEAEFIYIPSTTDVSQIFEFKNKTLLNTELEKFISENPLMYTTIETIRQNYRSLLTDEGMYKFIGILGYGTKVDIEINTANFSISKILQALRIETESMTTQEQFMILYNLQLYLKRKQFCIIYIDFLIDEETLEWLNRIKSKNTIILVSNNSIEDYMAEQFDSIIILTPNDYIETIELDKSQSKLISYALHPIVFTHPEYQNQKIIDIMRLFEDKTSSFSINFITDNDVKAFI